MTVIDCTGNVPPLHQDKGEEVHALRLVQKLISQAGPVAEPEYEVREGNPVALEVPKRPRCPANLSK